MTQATVHLMMTVLMVMTQAIQMTGRALVVKVRVIVKTMVILKTKVARVIKVAMKTQLNLAVATAQIKRNNSQKQHLKKVSNPMLKISIKNFKKPLVRWPKKQETKGVLAFNVTENSNHLILSTHYLTV